MSISSIRLYHLAATMPEPVGNALVTFDRRETLVVELVDDHGTSGWGETWPAPRPAAAVIVSQLANCLLGQAPEGIGRLWYAMRRKIGTSKGPAMMAVAALDMALHDLAARRLGVPLATLLGGAQRDRLPAYASGPFFRPGGHPYRTFEREVEGYLRAGFRAIKLRSGYAPAEDAKIGLAIRRLMGPEPSLMVDFNESYTPRAALAAVNQMAEAALCWIEEPAAAGDLEGYRLLSRQVTPALAGGESFTGATDFQPFLAAGCLDVLQPDIAICGGFSGVRQVAVLAELYGRPVVPHVWGGAINFHAALHLAATLPSLRMGADVPLPFLEYDGGPNPLLSITGSPTLNADGTVSVPDGPGLGIDLNAERLARFVVWHEEIRK